MRNQLFPLKVFHKVHLWLILLEAVFYTAKRFFLYLTIIAGSHCTLLVPCRAARRPDGRSIAQCCFNKMPSSYFRICYSLLCFCLFAVVASSPVRMEAVLIYCQNINSLYICFIYQVKDILGIIKCLLINLHFILCKSCFYIMWS